VSGLGGLTATDPVTKTVTASSPSCSAAGFSGEKCLCDTCNNASAQPCEANADCPISGSNPGVCGGRRCLGGSNAGAPCSANSACPSGGQCSRGGQGTRPSECSDDTTTPPGVFDCVDTMPIDGEGECTGGPIDSMCSVASGHGQRSCFSDGDCGGAVGSCEQVFRRCFLTGSAAGFGDVGTQTLIAAGMEDVPINDVSSPTLGAVFCVRHLSTSAVVDVFFGLPGPGRLQLKGTAEQLP
jgi:hypothetical protein